MDEDSINPFISDSERGDLLSSEDSEGSEDEEESAPPPKRLELDKDMAAYLKGATEKPLEHDKRKKLTARFPLPATDAAHPPQTRQGYLCSYPKISIYLRQVALKGPAVQHGHSGSAFTCAPPCKERKIYSQGSDCSTGNSHQINSLGSAINDCAHAY